MVDTNAIVEEVILRLKTDKAVRSADEFEKKLDSMFSKAALKAAAFNKVLQLGGEALQFFVDSMKDGVKAAQDWERTTIQQQTILRQLNVDTQAWTSELARQASVLEKLTGVGDEQIRTFQNMALNMGVSTDRVDDLVRASISLGNAMDIDVRTAMVQIVKTQTGLVEETLKSTRAVEGLTEAELKQGKAIDVINEKFGDQLDIMTKGTSGAIVGLNTAWANLNESIALSATNSGLLATALDPLTRKLEEIDRLFDPRQGGSLLQGLGALAGQTGPRSFAATATFGLTEILGLGKFLGFGGEGQMGGPGNQTIQGRRTPPPGGGGGGGGTAPATLDANFGAGFSGFGMTDLLGAATAGADLGNAPRGGQPFTTEFGGGEFETLAMRNPQMFAKLHESFQEGITSAAESNAELRAGFAEREAQRTAAAYENMATVGQGAFTTFTAGAARSLALLAAGQDDAAEKMMLSVLGSIGGMLIGQGASNIVGGIWPFNPAQIGAGVAQTAVGALLVAGQAAAASSAAGSGASAGDAGTRRALPSQSGGFGGGASSPAGQPIHLNITMVGSLSNEETLNMLTRSLRRAQASGLLT